MKDEKKYDYDFVLFGYDPYAAYAAKDSMHPTTVGNMNSHYNTLYTIDEDWWGRPIGKEAMQLTMLGWPEKDVCTKKLATKIMLGSDGIICALDLTHYVDAQIDCVNTMLKYAAEEIKATEWVKAARNGSPGQPDLVPYDLPPVYLMITNYTLDATKAGREQLDENAFDGLKSRINYPVKDVFPVKQGHFYHTTPNVVADTLRENADFRKLSKVLETYIEVREKDTREYHSTLAAFFKPKGRSRTEKLEVAKALKEKADAGKELSVWDFWSQAFENGELEKLVSPFRPK